MRIDVVKAGEEGAFPKHQAPTGCDSHFGKQARNDLGAMRHKDDIGVVIVQKTHRRLRHAAQVLVPDGFGQDEIGCKRLGGEEVGGKVREVEIEPKLLAKSECR
jgi:hypothetical protein